MGTQRAISDHDTKILSLLREQRTQGIFTDVKIVSANTVFWAHACVLAPFSSLISKIFYSRSQGSEKKWSTQCPCTLTFPNNPSGSKSSIFCEECIQKVIDFIYCGQITVDRNHSEHVQFVVRFLEIENLPVHGSNTDQEISVEKKTFRSYDLKTDFIKEKNSSPTSHTEKSKLNLKPSKAVRISFENILSENDSLISKNESVQKSTTGVADPVNSISFDKKIQNDTIVAAPSTQQIQGIPEKFSENLVKKVKIATKRKLTSTDFLCLFCPFNGSSALELIKHKLKANHEKDLSCFLCPCNYSSNEEFVTHLKEHLDMNTAFSSDQNEKNNMFKCEICNKEFGRRQNFQRHLDSHSVPHKKCSSCDFVTNSGQALNYHIRKMHSDLSFSCHYENCSFKTKRKGNLKNHILSVHKKTRLCCSNCDKTFSQKKNLQRHMNLYHNTLTMIHHCSLCTYVTHRADNLQKHKLSMHKIKGMQGRELQVDETAPEKPPSPVTLSVIAPQNRNKQFSQNPIDVNFCLNTSISNSSTGSPSPVTLNVVSSQNRDEQSFTQKPLDVNFCLSTSISGSSNFSPVVSVSCSDFTVKNPNFSNPQLNLGLQGCIPAYSQNGSNFSLITNDSSSQNKSVSQMISLPDIDCSNTGTLSFNETAGTLTYHNLNSDSTGALILNETTGELTYIKLVPQMPAVHEYSNFSCSEYSLPCTNYSLANDTVILNESTGELDSIKQQELLEFDRTLGRYDEDAMLFDPADDEEEENELLDFDPTEFMNESNSNPEIPVLNEWTGEINLLPNNFLGGPFLDEQTGQLSVFDLFDNDAIFDCLEEPPLPNIILNENTGEILRNNKTDTANDFRPNEMLAEVSDCAVCCEDLTLDNDCEYSLNEATGQLSIEWPDVSEDSNFSFLLNELTGELSVKGVNG